MYFSTHSPRQQKRTRLCSPLHRAALAHALKDKSNKMILFPLPTPSNKKNELDKQTACSKNTGSTGGRSDKLPSPSQISQNPQDESQSLPCRSASVVSLAWPRKARRVSGEAAKGRSGEETPPVCLLSPASQLERKARHFSPPRYKAGTGIGIETNPLGLVLRFLRFYLKTRNILPLQSNARKSAQSTLLAFPYYAPFVAASGWPTRKTRQCRRLVVSTCIAAVASRGWRHPFLEYIDTDESTQDAQPVSHRSAVLEPTRCSTSKPSARGGTSDTDRSKCR